MKSHEARCTCGAIRFIFTGKPYTVYACHCTTCQRRTGSAFGLSMIVPAKSIEVTKGETDDTLTEDGRTLRYCGSCRCLMIFEASSETHCIFPGMFDDKTWFKPVSNNWVRSAQPWVYIDSNLKSYQKDPDFAELYRLYDEASCVLK